MAGSPRLETKDFLQTLNYTGKANAQSRHYYNRPRLRVSRRSAIPKQSPNPLWKFLLPIFGVWVLLYGSYALSRPPLPDGSATIHAEIAREMLSRNDWSAAHVNGLPVASSSRPLDLSIAVSYKLFGVSDWAARLPVALSVLGLAFIAYFLGRSLFATNAAGLYAALMILTWPGTFVATRDLNSVPFLCVETALIAVVLWQLLAAKKLAGAPGIVVAAMACLLVLLTDSWAAMAVPLAIAIACWIARRSRPPARLVQWPLIAWAAAACLFGGLLEARPRNPLTWIGPVPPLALLIGGWLAGKETFAMSAKGRRVGYGIFAVGILVAAASILLAILYPLGFPFYRSSVLVTTPASRIPYFILAAALIAGLIGNLIFRLRNRARIANCFLAGMLAGITVAIQAARVIASPFHSSQILAEAIRPELDPTDIVAVDGRYSDASSLAFYLERPISIAVPAPANLSPTALPSWRGLVVVNQVWSGPGRVFLWTSANRPLAVPGESFVVARSGGKEILSNRPNAGGATF